MTGLKNFNDFLSEGIVRKQMPDLSRANFLISETEKSFISVKEIVDKIGIKDSNANLIIKLSYDLIMELLRAKMMQNGLNASGNNAHEAEVSYLRILNFSEKEVQFADKLRYFRNGITYYGKIMDKEYAQNVFKFLNEIYPKLLKLIRI